MEIETMEPEIERSETNPSKVVSESEWLVARKDLLTREKELTRLQDQVEPISPNALMSIGWNADSKSVTSVGTIGTRRLANCRHSASLCSRVAPSIDG